MAVSAGPKIVKDGLVLCLDAGNSESYPGTGTTWADLSSYKNNANIYSGSANGAVFSGDTINNSRFIFDGTDDYMYADPSLREIYDNFCYDLWFQPQTTQQVDGEGTSGFPGTTGQRYIIFPDQYGYLKVSNGTDVGISVGTNCISVYEHGPGYMPCLLAYQTTINSIVNITLNYINRQPSLYINGNFVRTGLTSPRSRCYVSSNIGGRAYGNFPGSLYIHRIYNRPLTAQEITQNFNALRGRYGI